jgi:glycosyltransferase involved in cell wall biosynthesis
MKPWVVIAGDFTPLGGMDRANYALASTLAARHDGDVHLVAHRVWPDLAREAAVHVHDVRRPLGSHLLGAPLLASAGKRWADRAGRSARVVANGGNADTGDVVWVHYLHAAHTPYARGLRQAIQVPAAHKYYLARERTSLSRARLIVCNSVRTSRDIQDRLRVEPSRLRVVYYGSDAQEFAPIGSGERAAARHELGWREDRPVALFIGALADRRKGFDRLFEAWKTLCSRPAWDMDLAVAGHGSELTAWQRRAADAGLAHRIKFLGFRRDVAKVIAASDLLVHPARYEAYGLGVHEAICRGLPAIVSAHAGVAEVYPSGLRDLLIEDVEQPEEIADRIERWRGHIPETAACVAVLSARLRARTWNDMSMDLIQAAES